MCHWLPCLLVSSYLVSQSTLSHLGPQAFCSQSSCGLHLRVLSCPWPHRQVLPRNQCILACGHIFSKILLVILKFLRTTSSSVRASGLVNGSGFSNFIVAPVPISFLSGSLGLGFLGVATIPEMDFPSHLTSFGLLLIVGKWQDLARPGHTPRPVVHEGGTGPKTAMCNTKVNVQSHVRHSR